MVDVQCWMLVVIPAIQMTFINYYGKISPGITIPIGKEHVKIYMNMKFSRKLRNL